MPDDRVSEKIRKAVIQRALGCCEYCRSQVNFAVQSFSVEHIRPRDKGGLSMLENLALSCQGCNNYKYNKTDGIDPITGLPAPLFHPRQQMWGEHFTWNDDYTLMIGLTSTGRATVDTLQVNRPGVVNLRRVLYTSGDHPPPFPSPTTTGFITHSPAVPGSVRYVVRAVRPRQTELGA
ncbi:HNH endonuclease [Candidatus Gracilibacteria bacterium]|nr:HNH endonuclease [Candidatus Gracilibacteria bacterium]